jgi:hypothetical protein
MNAKVPELPGKPSVLRYLLQPVAAELKKLI